jgi:hypothetical protein
MKSRLRNSSSVPHQKIYGTLAANLDSAVMSATRFRHQKVYPDTLRHWRDLVDAARRSVNDDGLAPNHPIALAADRLERELNDRAEPA